MELEDTFTIITVFGHSATLIREWVNHHYHIIPDKVNVFLVENLSFPHPEVNVVLYRACREKERWVPFSTLRHIVPYRYFSHGEALDMIIRYVRTPYVLTLDSDAFIVHWYMIMEMVEIALREDAVIVGWLLNGNNALPYIHPFCALYRTDFIRKVGMKEFYSFPNLLPWEYLKHFREDVTTDSYKETRRRYLDIGQKAYYDAINAGLKVVEYPIVNGVYHQWSRTPLLVMWAWHPEYSIRFGGEYGRSFMF